MQLWKVSSEKFIYVLVLQFGDIIWIFENMKQRLRSGLMVWYFPQSWFDFEVVIKLLESNLISKELFNLETIIQCLDKNLNSR